METERGTEKRLFSDKELEMAGIAIEVLGDNVRWRVKDIKTLPEKCSCISELVKHMLMFAVEDKIKYAQGELKSHMTLLIKYPDIDPYMKKGWLERTDGAKVEAETYKVLLDELRNIKVC